MILFDVSAISTIARNAYELITSLYAVVTTQEHKQALTDIGAELVKLRGIAFDLAEENCALKRQIEDMKRDEKRFDKYELTPLADGVFVYAEKILPEHPVSEGTRRKKPHYLCTTCFERREKTVLQRIKHDGLGVHWHCPSCKFTLYDHSKIR